MYVAFVFDTMFLAVIACIAGIYAFMKIRSLLVSNRFIVDGKYCLVTGGSQGLGKSIATQLVKKGAHVLICARRKVELVQAVEELKALKIHDSQKIDYLECDVTNSSQVETLFLKNPIQFVFCCVGGSKPMLFEDQTISQLEKSLALNYTSALYTCFYAVKQMKQIKENCKIVFVGSTLSCFGMIGFSEYVPSKFALRGLAETLRNELLKDNIDVHIYLPGSIDTVIFNSFSQDLLRNKRQNHKFLNLLRDKPNLHHQMNWQRN